MSASHSRQRIRGRSPVQGHGRAAVACLSIVLLASVGCPAPATLNLGISAQEHTQAYFPITDDAVHALGAATVSGPMSCGSCHGGTTSFTVVKCIECHQNDVQPPTAVIRASPGSCRSTQRACRATPTERGGANRASAITA